MSAVASLLLVVLAQTADPREPGPPVTPTSATAVRAEQPPVIDGRDQDAVWRTARPIADFLEFEPVQGKAPRFRTEARVAYDHRNFYVFIRMYDDEPAMIRRLFARRDVRTASDQVKIMIDSYHDRRSGYSFAVNPAGVKRDYVIYGDQVEDESWDGVWDVATTVDSLGWTAEFRIPLSQLRYPRADRHTFGFGIWRDIDRFKERVSWPLYRRDETGLASQLGTVTDIVGLASPRRLEIAPYAVARSRSGPGSPDGGTTRDLTGGLDFKYGLTSNLTVDGTVNPDFGQVEADPSVVNLTAFETFFQERRPFFIEGTGIFRSELNCSVVNCNAEGLFYSRRIGRAPQLAPLYGDGHSATASTILGATKLTGRLPGGLSLGVLDAITARHEGTLDRTIEPTTNYAVVRALQELRDGQTGIGFIGTSVHRSLDEWTEPVLRSGALAGGVDLRHRFAGGRYEVQAKVVGSRVTGSPEAIAATQRSAVHYFQRPDAPLTYDPTRTSLSGHAEQIKIGKFGGGLVRFESSYQRISPGFEVNDLGFLQRADWQDHSTWASLNFNEPRAFYLRAFWNFNYWQQWTAGGLPLERALNTNAHAQLRNNIWLRTGLTWFGLGETYCDRCARGGPALRTDPGLAWWAGIQGDDRGAVVPFLWLNYNRQDGGRSDFASIEPSLNFRVSTRWSGSLGARFSRNRPDRQWYGNFVDEDEITHHTFARLDQRTASLSTRINFTASPTLTLQVYAAPFVSRGTYSDVRELADPRAGEYDSRFMPYGDEAVRANPGGFNVRQFRSNTVLRWEYRPGSAVFLVWAQGRQGFEPEAGDRSFWGDFRELFRARPDNTLLVKVSYWLDW